MNVADPFDFHPDSFGFPLFLGLLPWLFVIWICFLLPRLHPQKAVKISRTKLFVCLAAAVLLGIGELAILVTLAYSDPGVPATFTPAVPGKPREPAAASPIQKNASTKAQPGH